MFVLKDNINDQTEDLYTLREEIKALKKKEKIIADNVKNYLLSHEKEEYCYNGIIAKLVKNVNNEICPSDLFSRLHLSDFLKLIKVKIKETKAFLNNKDFKEIALESITYSLKLKKE